MLPYFSQILRQYRNTYGHRHNILEHLDRTVQLPGHLNRAPNNGVTREELIEAITHLSFYSGWPTALTAATIAKDIFEARED